ncbi:thioredoxin fold domain-containing protein [Rhodoferax sp.]|uniref:thioredoxin fold domain-containing protein n=1 Tax=Rhodoferax sp. TaxID=50421 RepID=UPI002602D214|nr:thioredoxin fold domain-containing protein [Rhodoferax sp.]MDD2811584.1 thioredoxin fold domain-containing protein [Rhodoferax sp.]
MKTTTLTLSLIAAVALSVASCSKQETPAAGTTPSAVTSPTLSNYDTVAASGKGFTVGSMMSAQAVYVLFDPQCPHCGHLWQASQPLLSKVKFIWIPIAFNQGKSLPQAVALMNASNPQDTMSAHEASLLAGTGGLSAPSPSDDQVSIIKANTQLLTQLGVDSVPFVLAKNRRTGEVVSHNGAMETAELAKLLGVD